jgi:predicted transcriptional regulator
MSHKKPAKNVTADPDLAAWCAALVTAPKADTVPPGWLTARQLADKLGKSGSSVRHYLAEAVAGGRCARQDFRVPIGQTVRPVPHYRPTK